MENPQLILLIIGITLSAIIIILFMTTLICYLMAFYNKNKQDNTDEITQKEIAKKLGISRSYVSRIEKRAITKILREFIKNNKKIE